MNYKKYHRDKTYQENESHFKNIFMTRFRIANYFVKVGTSKKVLDIGASTGIMLDIFKEHGWETWGVEPSISALRAKNKKHKILKTYFEKVRLPENYFDLVIMNHTLEHLDNPKLILKKVYKILKKDGILLVDVPNAGSLASQIMEDTWPYRLPKEHKHQFTKESLSQVFKNSGFKVEYSKSRSGMFEFANPIAEIVEAFMSGKKRFFTDIINIPYDILVTSLNMGDSISVVGKK